MATASSVSEAGERECSICHELLTTPKLLPCGHHLCRHCLISWIQTKSDAACPLCRCAIVRCERKGADVEDVETVADGFPTDLFMEKLVEAERMLSKGHNCRACEDVAAVALCLQCGDMLCFTCKKAHKKLSMTKDHVIEDLVSLSAETLASKRPAVCPAHPEEMCKVYCPTHKASMCCVCACTEHKACPDLTGLSEKAEESCKRWEDLMDELNTGEERIDQAIDLLDQHVEKTEKYVRASVDEIEETRAYLESCVAAWEQGLKKQVLKEHRYVLSAAKEAKEHLLQRRGKLTTHKGIIRQGQGTENREVEDKMMTTMQTRMEELDGASVLPADAKVISALELTLDKGAVSRIEQELSQLGQVSVPPADTIGWVKPPSLQFHISHGRHVKLLDSNQTAVKSERQYGGGIVLACDPMKKNFLYEVQIVSQCEIVSRRRYKLETLSVGVVTEDPGAISLPENAMQLPSSFVLTRGWLKTPDSEQSPLGGMEVLGALHCGDCVGVFLDSANRLHLHLNGQERGVIGSDVPQPCYALFELCGRAGEIKALPVMKVTTKSISSG